MNTIKSRPGEYTCALREFSEYLERMRYSKNTTKAYLGALTVFFKYIRPLPVSSIDLNTVEQFNAEYIIANQLSTSYQNQVINAIKLFYSARRGMNLDVNALERPIKERRLPVVFSLKEVERLLSSTVNLKHKTMLMLIYSCGLRRGELLQLQIRDVDGDRMLIHIRAGKGKKDRMVPLSQKMLDQLRMYYKVYRPSTFMFEGMNGLMYGATSLQKVFKRSLIRARIQKPATLHTLCHSFATHLLENGVSLRYIQEILGHSSSKTTEIYAHVRSRDLSKIINPMDNLKV